MLANVPAKFLVPHCSLPIPSIAECSMVPVPFKANTNHRNGPKSHSNAMAPESSMIGAGTAHH